MGEILHVVSLEIYYALYHVFFIQCHQTNDII